MIASSKIGFKLKYSTRLLLTLHVYHSHSSVPYGIVKSQYKISPKPRLRVIKRYHMSKWDLTGFYPSVYIRNQLPVIKLSASATIRDMIGYFHEIYLNFSS